MWKDHVERFFRLLGFRTTKRTLRAAQHSQDREHHLRTLEDMVERLDAEVDVLINRGESHGSEHRPSN